MRLKIFQYAFLGTFMLFSSCTKNTNKESQDRGYKVKVGDIAPDFTTTLTSGETFKLSEQKGKIVMIQFTASWCSVCRKEMPFIEKEIYQPNLTKDFVLLAIDKGEKVEKINEFVKKTGVTYPIGLDEDSSIFGKYTRPKAGVTRNIIIDRNGKIIFLTRLFDRAEFNKMKTVIENELNKK